MITHDLNVAQHAKGMVRIVDGKIYEDEIASKVYNERHMIAEKGNIP